MYLVSRGVVLYHIRIHHGEMKKVKAVIKIKRNSCRDLKKNCDGVSFERYKLTKEAKKAVQNARVKSVQRSV